ncbi:MAG: DUF177 domain-containing protein [Alloprevotella sp.]|nr:DUF177 domain-containing protein [Alloprevotella sp.]
MANPDTFHLDLRNVGTEVKTFEHALGDDFFKALEQEEILGGNIKVTLKIREAAGDIFQLDIAANGTVRTVCDRCLEEVVLPVDTAERVRLAGNDEGGSDADTDTILLERNATGFNAAWLIYEVIATSLPTERTHAPGECDADMLGRISGIADAQDGEGGNEDNN